MHDFLRQSFELCVRLAEKEDALVLIKRLLGVAEAALLCVACIRCDHTVDLWTDLPKALAGQCVNGRSVQGSDQPSAKQIRVGEHTIVSDVVKEVHLPGRQEERGCY